MNRAVMALLCLGLCQMAADVAGLPVLKAMAAATGASPAPKVFTRFGGLEPFSMGFALEFQDREGQLQHIPITPARYARLRGPYNRRNAYGAAMAAGPALQADGRTRTMLESVMRHGLCDGAPVLRELGIDPADVVGAITIRYAPRADGNTAQLPMSLMVPCS